MRRANEAEPIFDLSSVGVKCPNNGRLGCFKNEAETRAIVEGVFLRSKVYGLQFADEVPILKSKGIPTFVIKRDESFESYKKMLLEPKPCPVTFNALSNKRCSLDRRSICRSGLTSDKDKVYWVSLGHARPLGHKDNPVQAESASV